MRIWDDFNWALTGALAAAIISFVTIGCGAAGSDTNGAASESAYAAPEMIGKIQTEDVKESSGLAASKCQENILWTHNDAGRGALIYALGTDGRLLGTWKVPNAQNTDWEDMAAHKEGGKCFLYIGDIGDNDQARNELTVYRVPEPTVSTAEAAGSPASAEAPELMRFSYPDSRNNAEALLVHPQSGDIFVLTKTNKGPSSVYKIGPAFGSAAAAIAQKLGEISVPSNPEGRLTGGAFAPDGTRVLLCDLKNGYELNLPAGAAADDIWKQKPTVVNLGDRPQGEAVSYSADGTAIYASSEKKNAPLFMIKRK